MDTPKEILNNPFINKGTAFTLAERKQLNLVGLLPPVVQTLEEQIERTYSQYQKKTTDLEKRVYLMTLFNTNRTLFYALMAQHVEEFMPIVYDPTVADAIRQYDELFMKPQDAAFLSIDHPEEMEQALLNASKGRNVKTYCCYRCRSNLRYWRLGCEWRGNLYRKVDGLHRSSRHKPQRSVAFSS